MPIIEKVLIDEQKKVSEISGTTFPFKIQDNFTFCFYSTIEKITSNTKWFTPGEPYLKELYLSIWCGLYAEISQQPLNPNPDDFIKLECISGFIVNGDSDKDYNPFTLAILAQLYTFSANYCFSLFADDRRSKGKNERISLFPSQDILNDWKTLTPKKYPFPLPVVLDTVHSL